MNDRPGDLSARITAEEDQVRMGVRARAAQLATFYYDALTTTINLSGEEAYGFASAFATAVYAELIVDRANREAPHA